MATRTSLSKSPSALSWVLRGCIAFALGAASPAQALVIDSFDSGESFSLEPINGAALLTQSAQVLGGTREIWTSGRIAFDPRSGLDMFSSVVTLTYRMPETDLTANGEDRFLVTLAETPLPADSMSLAILVTTPGVDGGPPFCHDDGGCYDGGLITTYGRAESVPVSGPIDFALFPDFGLLVMAHAQEISLSFYGYRADQAAFIVRVLDFRTVPEPPTALLGAISALALLAGRTLLSKLGALRENRCATLLRKSEPGLRRDAPAT